MSNPTPQQRKETTAEQQEKATYVCEWCGQEYRDNPRYAEDKPKLCWDCVPW